MDKQNKIILGGAILVIILILSFDFINKSYSKRQETDNSNIFIGEFTLDDLSKISNCPFNNDKDVLAKCLTEKGFVMYGAYWCEHCLNQKKAFGDSFKYIKYVECTEEIKFCMDKGITGFPTWIKEEVSTSSIKLN